LDTPACSASSPAPVPPEVPETKTVFTCRGPCGPSGALRLLDGMHQRDGGDQRALTAAAASLGASAVTAGETLARSSSLLAVAGAPLRLRRAGAATRCRGCRSLPRAAAGAAAGVVAAVSTAMGRLGEGERRWSELEAWPRGRRGRRRSGIQTAQREDGEAGRRASNLHNGCLGFTRLQCRSFSIL
jgi:hypothetical protein